MLFQTETVKYHLTLIVLAPPRFRVLPGLPGVSRCGPGEVPRQGCGMGQVGKAVAGNLFVGFLPSSKLETRPGLSVGTAKQRHACKPSRACIHDNMCIHEDMGVQTCKN